MGADMVLVIVEAPDTLSYDTIQKQIVAMSDEDIDVAIEYSFGAEFSDVARDDDTRQAFARRHLDTIIFKTRNMDGLVIEDVSRAIWYGPINGKNYMIAGGMSWGDVEPEYDSLNFLNELQVLT